MKYTPVFLITNENGDTVMVFDSLIEAKHCKDFIRENFNLNGKKLSIKEKIITKPDSKIKNKESNYLFGIIDDKGNILDTFDSLNEAKFFLNRLKNMFGEPKNRIKVKQLIPEYLKQKAIYFLIDKKENIIYNYGKSKNEVKYYLNFIKTSFKNPDLKNLIIEKKEISSKKFDKLFDENNSFIIVNEKGMNFNRFSSYSDAKRILNLLTKKFGKPIKDIIIVDINGFGGVGGQNGAMSSLLSLTRTYNGNKQNDKKKEEKKEEFEFDPIRELLRKIYEEEIKQQQKKRKGKKGPDLGL